MGILEHMHLGVITDDVAALFIYFLTIYLFFIYFLFIVWRRNNNEMLAPKIERGKSKSVLKSLNKRGVAEVSFVSQFLSHR